MPSNRSLETALSLPGIEVVAHPEVNKRIFHYAEKDRFFIKAALVRRQPYTEPIERVFREHNLPVELINIALIESMFSPNARSNRSAVGLWQFTAATARRFGLHIGRRGDERQDVEKSTHAAAKYLVELYEQYGNWPLVLAAYNTGPARVNRAIQEGGTTDFFSLAEKGLFCKETRNFVPKFLALTQIMRHLDRFGFEQEDVGQG